MPAGPAPSPYYQYAAGHYETVRATAIDRTKTGLLILVIGFLLGWVPIVGIVSIVLELVGAILVTLGRRTFGPEHARNVIWSIIIFVVAIGVVFAIAIIVAVSAISTLNPNDPLSRSTFESSIMGVIIAATFVGIVIFGLTEVLFTYALQKSGGRLLLWCGYASSIVVASIGLFRLTSIPNLSNALSIIPAIIYAYAYYLARYRIVRGEIPPPLAATIRK